MFSQEQEVIKLTNAVICSHGQNVLTCPICNELLPTSLWRRMVIDRFAPEPNTYHVTTLTSCLTKSYFERTTPVEESVEAAWSKLRGSLIHYLGRSLGWNELRVKTSFELDGQAISIIGYVDAYDPATATTYDLKTTRFIKWQDEKGFIPRQNHIAQVQCYYTLLSLLEIPVRRLVLVYVDDRNILAKQVSLCNRKEWMMQRATLLSGALANSEAPEPEPDSSCRYCPFIRACPKGAKEIKSKENKE